MTTGSSEKEKLEKCWFLELFPENIFDFMVLIIFLRNHSRIKHKDLEIVSLSAAPQWSSLVKKTTRTFFLSFLPTALFFFYFSPSLSLLFFFFYNSLKERRMGPRSSFVHLFGVCGSHVTDTCLAETILF